MAFQTLQRQFLAHLRNPAKQPLPTGFNDQRVGIYADLLYNKFNDSLEMCFPVTRELLGELAWQHKLKAFIAQHRCLSPYYRQIPDEFMVYLQSEAGNENDPPYLLELAHFEWIEMVLAITEVEPLAAFHSDAVNDWLDVCPVFVPVLQLLHYAYPVQRINLHYKPNKLPEQATHILGFRDANDTVQFIELNSATARLVDILHSTGGTVREAMQKIATELQHPEPSELFTFGHKILADLAHQGAILGAQTH
ncbi:MAG: putative DNA-binding domain-containing protein [Methylococcales bacterium]